MWSMSSIMLATIASIGFGTVSADLSIVPKDTVAKAGETTFLNCSTKLLSKQVHWLHATNYVYAGGPVLDPYFGRCRIQNSSEGAYNLVIQSVEAGDAGKYICQYALGDVKNSAELIVIESDPVCTSNIDPNEIVRPNNCGLVTESMQFNCSLSYSGNIPPQMVWKRHGDNTNIKEGVTMSSDGITVSYNLAINASDLKNNEHSFVCETTQATNIQYNCSTPDIKISCATEITALDTSPEESLSSIWVIIVVLVAIGIVAALVVAVVCFIKRRRMNEDPIENGRTKELQPLNYNSGDNIVEEKQEKENDEMPIKVSIEESNQMISSKKDVVDEEKVGKKEGDEKRNRNIEAELTWHISHGKSVRAMAVSEFEIYILTYDPIFLEIYSTSQHVCLSSNLLDKDLKQPLDMAYGHKSHRLYVMDGTVEDQSNNMIVFDQQGKKVTSWPTNARFGNISVAAIDDSIVLAHPKGIEEYSPDGKLIREICVQESVIPRCAIKMSDYEFLISRGQREGDLFEVCLVKISEHPSTGKIHSVEQIEKSFGKNSVLRYSGLKDRHSLAVFENKDVALLDEGNNRVVLLDSDLTFRQEILLSNYGLKEPVKLCLADSDQRLIIVGNFVSVKGAGRQGPGILILSLT